MTRTSTTGPLLKAAALAALAAALPAQGARAEGPPALADAGLPRSAPAARRPEPNPFTFQLSGDAHGAGVRLNYAIRWGGPVEKKPQAGRDPGGFGRFMRRSFVVELFGLSVRPTELVAGRKSVGPTTEAAEEGEKPRLDLGPLLSGLVRDLGREGVMAGFALALPSRADNLDGQTKRAMMDSLLMVDRQNDIPLLRIPAHGARFMLDGI